MLIFSRASPAKTQTTAMDVRLVLLLIAFAYTCLGAAPLCGHSNHQPDCSTLVDAAILDVELYYDDHLCRELLTLDCAKHVLARDEVLCGTDGNTYNNHCLFTQARCHNLELHGHSKPVIRVASHGTCPTTTIARPTTQQTQAVHGVTEGEITTTSVPTTTTAPTTKATHEPSTTDPVHNVIANVFCQQASTIDCNTGFNVVCGSDNQYYPNDCELSKAKCVDPNLVKVDPSHCQP